jgi:hypothetical protein
MTARRRLSVRRARQVIDAATLVKAPDWPDTRHWHVVSGDLLLVVVAPSYGGTSRSGRNGWRWWLTATGPTGNRDHWASREGAAAAGLAAWQRWTTSRDTP